MRVPIPSLLIADTNRLVLEKVDATTLVHCRRVSSCWKKFIDENFSFIEAGESELRVFVRPTKTRPDTLLDPHLTKEGVSKIQRLFYRCTHRAISVGLAKITQGLKSWNQLRILELHSATVTDAHLTPLFTLGCKFIQSLTLECVQLSDATLRNLGNASCHLTTLRIASPQFTDEGLICAVKPHSSSLQHLEIAKAQLTDDGLLRILYRLTEGMKTLTIRNPQPVQDALFGWEVASVSHIGVQSIAAWLATQKMVTTVRLEGCPKIEEKVDEVWLAMMIKNCGAHLSLSRCTEMHQDDVTYILKNIPPKLKSLDLSETRVTDLSLKGLQDKKGELSSLSLRKCRQLTDVGCKYLLQRHLVRDLDCDLSGCENIKTIALNGEQTLNEHKLVRLLKYWDLPNSLNLFNVANCPHISPCTALCATTRWLPLGIQQLDLSGHRDQPLVHAEAKSDEKSEHILTLKEFQYRGSSCLCHEGGVPCLNDDEKVDEAQQHLQKFEKFSDLRTLSLNYFPHLNQNGLGQLLSHLPPLLQFLSVNGIKTLVETVHLERKLPLKLQKISLTNSQISDQALTTIRQQGVDNLDLDT